MIDDFKPLEDLLEALTANMSPAERKILAAKLATDLRRANARRMRANIEPEGEAMVPRKAAARPKSARSRDRIGSLKKSKNSRAMFLRATGTGYLRKISTSGEAQVGFVGAMARIMRVHHYGLRDTVTRDPNSPAATYPARRVLGINPDDRVRILDLVAAQLEG